MAASGRSSCRNGIGITVLVGVERVLFSSVQIFFILFLLLFHLLLLILLCCSCFPSCCSCTSCSSYCCR